MERVKETNWGLYRLGLIHLTFAIVLTTINFSSLLTSGWGFNETFTLFFAFSTLLFWFWMVLPTNIVAEFIDPDTPSWRKEDELEMFWHHLLFVLIMGVFVLFIYGPNYMGFFDKPFKLVLLYSAFHALFGLVSIANGSVNKVGIPPYAFIVSFCSMLVGGLFLVAEGYWDALGMHLLAISLLTSMVYSTRYASFDEVKNERAAGVPASEEPSAAEPVEEPVDSPSILLEELDYQHQEIGLLAAFEGEVSPAVAADVSRENISSLQDWVDLFMDLLDNRVRVTELRIRRTILTAYERFWMEDHDGLLADDPSFQFISSSAQKWSEMIWERIQNQHNARREYSPQVLTEAINRNLVASHINPLKQVNKGQITSPLTSAKEWAMVLLVVKDKEYWQLYRTTDVIMQALQLTWQMSDEEGVLQGTPRYELFEWSAQELAVEIVSLMD